MKAFDTQLFKRILSYAKPYKWFFRGVVIWGILLSLFTALRPYLLKETVNFYIEPKDSYGLMIYIIFMGIVLILEVVSQFYFVLWANRLGQDIVKDIRIQ
ncbi:MAG TPA: hypothetical protein VLZ72_08045, partial [Flavobacterium sp.]|nr:hypothetical protein [Flavobacterium sp.]